MAGAIRLKGGNSLAVIAIGSAALFVVALMLLMNSESTTDLESQTAVQGGSEISEVAAPRGRPAAAAAAAVPADGGPDTRPIPDSYKCTAQEKQKQDARFKRRDSEAWAHTACPDESWLDALQTAYKKMGKKKLEIYDIGCNKGYTSANFLASFAPDYGITPMNTFQKIEEFARVNKISIDKACGVCGDCYEKITIAKGLGKDPFDVRVHCFEPAPSSFAILEYVYDKLKPPSGTRHTWLQHNMGLYNESGDMMWHESCAHAGGGELCGIVAANTPNAIKVPVVTVDDFAKQNGVWPDLLKIDAEGFDPAVLAGAEETLNYGHTPLVLFEFNPALKSGGLWHKIKLDPVINWFDTLGYDCYFESDTKGSSDPATPSFYRITGNCLSTYPTAFRGWSNVICASRRDKEVAKVLSDRATMINIGL